MSLQYSVSPRLEGFQGFNVKQKRFRAEPSFDFRWSELGDIQRIKASRRMLTVSAKAFLRVINQSKHMESQKCFFFCCFSSVLALEAKECVMYLWRHLVQNIWSHPTLPRTARLSPTLAVTRRSPARRHAVTVVPSCLSPSSSALSSISDSVDANAARNSPSSSSGGCPKSPVEGAALAT